MTRSKIEEANGAQGASVLRRHRPRSLRVAAVACNRREPLENESGHYTKDLLKGRIHCQEDAAPPPHWKS